MTAIYDIPLRRIDGTGSSLGAFRGKVILAVNVASRCGLTPQYRGLEALHERYSEAGLVVAGFPSNEFAGQEPGSNAEIATFCQTVFGVRFPMFEKIAVKGAGKHPLYAALTSAAPRPEGAPPNAPDDGEIIWNFEKFLIDRTGGSIRRFAPNVTPEDPALIAAIEAALAAPAEAGGG